MPADSTIQVIGVADSDLREQIRAAIAAAGADAQFETAAGSGNPRAVVLAVEDDAEAAVQTCRTRYDCALIVITADAAFAHAQALLDAGADDVVHASQLQRLPVSLATTSKAAWTRAEHEQRYALQKAVNDHSPTEIFVKDLEGRYVYVNATTAQRYARFADDLVGLRAQDIFPPADAAVMVEHDRAVLASGRVVTRMVEIFDQHLHVTKFPIYDRERSIVGLGAIAVDVTALHETQRALRAEEEHFRFLVENSSDFVTVLDSHGLIRYQSPSFAKETGYVIGDRIGKSPLLFVHCDDRDAVNAAIKDLLDGPGRTQTLVYRFESKPGDWRHVESRCRSVAGESGELEVIVNSRDVSKRMVAEAALLDAEAALRANEELLQGIMDHSPHEVFIKDLDKRYVFFNKRCEELIGVTNENARGKRSFDVFPTHVAQRMEQHDQQVIDSQRTVVQQEDVPYVDGVHTIIIAKFPIRDADGALVRIGAVATDITEGSAAARALRVSEEHFRNLVEGSLQGILIHNLKDMLFVNQAFQDIFGYRSIDEVRAAYAEQRVIAGHDWERIAGYARASLDGNESPQRFEFDAIKADGTAMHVEASERRINWQGKPALQATVLDITERKRAEQALRQSQTQLRALTMLAPTGIFRTDENGVTTYVNEHWSELTGIVTSRPAQDDWLHYLHDADRDRVMKHWRDRLASRSVFRDEYRYQRPHRSLVWVYCVANPQYDEQGEFTGYIGALTNITARKQAQAELEKYRDHLEELVDARTAELRSAVREQESFSYSVSHDLRSPLRAIDGFSHMLLDDYAGVLDDKGKQCLHRVRDASQRMGLLIDALLNLSRMSRRKMRFETVDLSEIAHDILRRLKRTDPQREAQCDVAPDLTARGDSALLRVVLENLLSNAWKYSNKQPVTRIEVGPIDGRTSGFLVRDNGVGFDMRYVDKLFKPFQRLHTFDEFEGTGIGLATVVRIVERHGGRVWAESEEGKGATFYFTV